MPEKAAKNWVVYDTAVRKAIKHQFGYSKKLSKNDLFCFPQKAVDAAVRTAIKHESGHDRKSSQNLSSFVSCKSCR